MTTSAAARQKLVEALSLDLVGPDVTAEDYQDEIISQAPSKWYLSGFLVPYEASVEDRSGDNANDEIGSEVPSGRSSDDETTPDTASARKVLFPSSIGLSFLVSDKTTNLDVEIYWGDYLPIKPDGQVKNKDKSDLWQRQRQLQRVSISLANSKQPVTLDVPHSNGLKLAISDRPVQGTTKLPPGTRAISIFLVNHRQPKVDSEKETGYIFQAQLTIHNHDGFIPRPDLRERGIEDEDDRIADLQYRDDYEFAVGHNVSALAFPDSPTTHCTQICTAWIPTAEVEKVIATDIPNVTLGMEKIADAETAEAIRSLISPMVQAYTEWLDRQSKTELADLARADTSHELLHRATLVNKRIAAGLQALDDPDVLTAFRMANRAIATAFRQRKTHNTERSPESVEAPNWRPFQLAFLLMNLVGIAEPTSNEREIVDLLFFPTGGGKTEAYLGLAAFTLVLRRLHNPGIHGAGTSVLMRYTLRLLTLDQLSRAATLVCALELERSKDPAKLGVWPFEIGLWVGSAATPNEMGRLGDKKDHTARQKTIDYQSGKTRNSPIPLDSCPWCGDKFDKRSFHLHPNEANPLDLKITCSNRSCDFRGDRPLPIVTVDDAIYRRLPCFIIATVDKFASLPWVGRTAGLFGKVNSYSTEGFYGTATTNEGNHKLPQGLLPPDLIIQDELHLISGPLGTMVGLYETAIEALSSRTIDGQVIKPKIVASTATVRRATSQIRALFGRTQVEVFPPPGPDRRDSFFAKTEFAQTKNPRLYVGISGQGRSLKVVLLRTYLALLGASQKLWEQEKGARNHQNPVDPYMTLVGYFNSLRELGGSRRIVEDEVRSLLDEYSQRKRETEADGSFANRKIADDPLELTSRVSTSEVAAAKGRLEQAFHGNERKNAVDVVLATNMISVGLDITRLGLMVVLGQPKTTAEYIQATSRVGRDDERPGLVITLLNIHRPRDRSHYERFQAWHNTFYRAVEATSVTPFSARAIDRGLAGITVALARLGCDRLTAPKQAIAISQERQNIQFVVDTISQRAAHHNIELSKEEAEAERLHLRTAVIDLLDDWEFLAAEKQGKLQYQQEVGDAPPLLYDCLDPELFKQSFRAQKFKAQRSLRDVEKSVNLWIERPDGKDFGGES